MTLPYPPPFMDLRTLAEHICAGERSIERWVSMGTFPKPRLQEGKRLWEWAKVKRHLAARNDDVPASGIDTQLKEITDATRRALQGA